MSHYLKKIVELLTSDGRQCLDAAVSLAVSHNHHEVGIEHLLLSTLAAQPVLVEELCLKAGLRGDRLVDALQLTLQQQRRGNTSGPVFSLSLVNYLEMAWLHASVVWQHERLAASAFIACLLAHRSDHAFAQAQAMSTALQCDAELADELLSAAAKSTGVGQIAVNASQENTALKKYTHNLTERAREGKLDPVSGREYEIRQMTDVLLRRRQNNPVLVGDPGVGKTALVEGLAQLIVSGNVPPRLQNMAVLALDLTLLQAGASVKGEFEKRLQAVLKEVRAYASPVILFVDEAHMLIGAGGQAGQNDAANLLKPALARGEIRLIGATTWAEYKKYFEKDAALARRFQRIQVEEPDTPTAITMLRSLAGRISQHHGVPIPDSAIVAAVELSQRYITGRQLPDKAISLLDTACARVSLSQCHQPPEIENLNTLLHNIALERQSIADEPQSATRLDELAEHEAQIRQDLAALAPVWQNQHELVRQILACEDQTEKRSLRQQLTAMHQDSTLVYERVDPPCVAEIITGWTGIPAKNMLGKASQQLDCLTAQLEQRVIGQSHVIESIVQQIRISKADLGDPEKPCGVFMLTGPSGVGKTETALALADLLYGGRSNMIAINMSEYQEAHSVAGLKGSPPGYVGYGQGGLLTEAVRRQPYSVVLLDEAEKAHPDVMELFYQIFDKGMIEDSEGQKINFRNTLIILTSNLGSELLMAASDNQDSVALTRLIRPEFERVFRPALMGRLTLLPCLPLQGETLKRIIELKLGKLCQRFAGARRHRSLSYSRSVISYVADRCHVQQSGARDIDAVLARELLPLLTDRVLSAGDDDLHLRATVSGQRLVLNKRAKRGKDE